MADRRGFTIIEVMITVIILGILVLMAVPEVNGIVRMQRVKTEANKMASCLRTVQQDAVTQETASSLVFTGSSSYYAGGKTYSLPSEITYTVTPSGITQVSFSYLGVPSPPGAITIQFSDGEGRVQNVKINPSGRINIETP